MKKKKKIHEKKNHLIWRYIFVWDMYKNKSQIWIEFFFLPKSLTLFFNDFLTLTQTQNVFVWQERGILLLRCLLVLGFASYLTK